MECGTLECGTLASLSATDLCKRLAEVAED